jgi:signal transduction histidine kinase
VLVLRGKPTSSQSVEFPMAWGTSAFSVTRKTENARHKTSEPGGDPRDGTTWVLFGKGSSMASPILSRSERGQDADAEARPDRALREANRHMHEFLAELAHELRSPLGAICNALQLLALTGDDAAMRESALGLMERQAQCIGRLVNDLMEASRIENGKIPLRMERLDLAQCVAHAVETVRSSIENRGQQLEVVLPREPISVDADPGRLEQVLKNLLNNAAKYTEPGGQIWLTAEARGGDVVLRVRDNGMGIDREMLPHIFDSFWQVERTLIIRRVVWASAWRWFGSWLRCTGGT